MKCTASRDRAGAPEPLGSFQNRAHRGAGESSFSSFGFAKRGERSKEEKSDQRGISIFPRWTPLLKTTRALGPWTLGTPPNEVRWGKEERNPRLSPAIGGPRQAKACWGEDERRQRLRATNGSLRLSDASEDEAARLSGFRDDECAQ